MGEVEKERTSQQCPPTHVVIALAGGFVATLGAELITVGDVVHRRAEAVRVVALVARTAAAGPSCRRCGKTGS